MNLSPTVNPFSEVLICCMLYIFYLFVKYILFLIDLSKLAVGSICGSDELQDVLPLGGDASKCSFASKIGEMK